MTKQAVEKLTKLINWLEDGNATFRELKREFGDDLMGRIVGQWIEYNDVIIERIQPAIELLEEEKDE